MVFFADARSWADAEASCKAMGAWLAEPKTDQQNVEVKGLVLRNGGGQTWLGASDLQQEGRFVWAHSEGEVTGFTDWDCDQPDDLGGQDCVHMDARQDYRWDDDNCNDKKHYICQMPTSGPVIGLFGGALKTLL